MLGRGIFHGKSVLCRVDGQLRSYHLVLEAAPNGAVWFKTGMAGSKESIDKIIAEHSANALRLLPPFLPPFFIEKRVIMRITADSLSGLKDGK